MKVKWMVMVKDGIWNWWVKNKQKILDFSISVRYVLFVSVFLFTYLGSMKFCGFGVDGEGKLYVGRKTRIEVYQDGEQVNLLPTPFQKEAWNMGISIDEQIIATGSAKVFTLQLDGTVISEEEDKNSKISNLLGKQRLIEGNDGNQYRLRHEWIWPTITKNDRVIYMAPIVDMLGRLSLMLLVILVPPGLIYEIINDRKIRPEKSSDDTES